MRDDLREQVMSTLGSADGILVVDETGFPIKDQHSAGAARQYSGTLGKIVNYQVGVFLAYASVHGFAAIDRELYLPQTWLDDPARCRRARIPDGTPMRTRQQLAREMVGRALKAGGTATWVVADEVAGSDHRFRHALEARDQPYVVTVPRNSRWRSDDRPPAHQTRQLRPTSPTVCSQPSGTGSAVAWVPRDHGSTIRRWSPQRPAEREGWHHALLVRRHPDRLADFAWYLVFTPVATLLPQNVRAAGTRWTIEEAYKQAKRQVGLYHYEVRSWRRWYRHIAIALVALAALAAAKKGASSPSSTLPAPSPSSGACWSGSPGRSDGLPGRSAPGRAGDAGTSGSRGSAIAAGA